MYTGLDPPVQSVAGSTPGSALRIAPHAHRKSLCEGILAIFRDVVFHHRSAALSLWYGCHDCACNELLHLTRPTRQPIQPFLLNFDFRPNATA
jgi:hypothetical protein